MQLAALERAEQRLAAGTYGLSIESGEPIPDERLEVLPTAELTTEEERAGPGADERLTDTEPTLATDHAGSSAASPRRSTHVTPRASTKTMTTLPQCRHRTTTPGARR